MKTLAGRCLLTSGSCRDFGCVLLEVFVGYSSLLVGFNERGFFSTDVGQSVFSISRVCIILAPVVLIEP